MMPGSSFTSSKSTGAGTNGVRSQFPAGLRVLVVDDDPTWLLILEKMLKVCNYEATICNRAEIVLSFLREKKDGYDLVLSDVHMPDMDGIKLLEHIGHEMDLPVIMMSADDRKTVVMKGVTQGACDYLIKPVRIEALRNIWQHVVRRRKHEWKDFELLACADDDDHKQKVPEDLEHSSAAQDGVIGNNAKRRKEKEDEAMERDEHSTLKKPRVVWSMDLHKQFVACVDQLGIDKAVPKKILEMMNVPGITRENVASHLQKYRLYLRRLSGTLGSTNTTFMDIRDAGYGSMSSLFGRNRFPGQSSSTLQAAHMGSLNPNNSKSPISMPVLDQRNAFKIENPNLGYGEVIPPRLLHGIPTNMEAQQFAGFQQSQHHSFGSANGQVSTPVHSQTQTQRNVVIQVRNGWHQSGCSGISQGVPGQLAAPNGTLLYGLATNASRSEIVLSYNTMNAVNPIRPHVPPGFQDQDNAATYSSSKNLEPMMSFSSQAVNDDLIENYLMSDNLDYLVAALVDQQNEDFGQLESEFGFGGQASDDLSSVTPR